MEELLEEPLKEEEDAEASREGVAGLDPGGPFSSREGVPPLVLLARAGVLLEPVAPGVRVTGLPVVPLLGGGREVPTERKGGGPAGLGSRLGGGGLANMATLGRPPLPAFRGRLTSGVPDAGGGPARGLVAEGTLGRGGTGGAALRSVSGRAAAELLADTAGGEARLDKEPASMENPSSGSARAVLVLVARETELPPTVGDAARRGMGPVRGLGEPRAREAR